MGVCAGVVRSRGLVRFQQHVGGRGSRTVQGERADSIWPFGSRALDVSVLFCKLVISSMNSFSV